MVDIKILTVLILTTAVTTEKVPNVQTKLEGADARAFTSLLQNIINVNKGRLDSLKTLVKRQEQPAYPQRFGKIMRADSERDDDSESSDDRDPPEVMGYLVLPPLQTDDSSQSAEYHEKSRPPSKSQNSPLWNKPPVAVLRSCNSRAVRRCKRVCKRAVRNTCNTYSCRRQLRRYFKKECRLSCKDEFRSGNYRK